MSAETNSVPEEENLVEESTEVEEQVENEVVEESREEERVPLSALQKERRKRQEAERKSVWLEEINQKQLRESRPVEEKEDDSYEAATKADLRESNKKSLQQTQEQIWINNNPEKAIEVANNLKEFLNKRDHLRLAIEASPNRYEEAWTLMNAYEPKQRNINKSAEPPKKNAPGSPSNIPKAAGMNETVDFGQMTDDEFNKWRRSQIKRR